ncbi:carboxypeptidase-like regulatory domain-containing protein [uncultured Sunxiuqinia sp.]|uniref:carboxypeptidase-like regulatory domain-containing protein n=1 Tax=uncultured Sunxiuqinia sp. TaxID=1573825 RepID=UPI002AA71871|nr:carboxypeptidase-like regulatory domain-containing protein [uncultured Sunxiuqinia sp.]
MKTSTLIASLFLVSFLAATAGNNQTIDIHGKVVNKETREPLYGVNISLKNQTKSIGTITNSQGEFRLWNIPCDTADLLISMNGYKSDTIDLETLDQSTEIIVISLAEKTKKENGLKLIFSKK